MYSVGVKCARWCDVEWWCVACEMCCGARCEMWLRNTDVEWFDAILDMVWCGTMVEMQCGMCGAVWNVCCEIVWCAIWMWCDVHGMMRGGMWAWCGMVRRDVVERFDVNYGAMWNVCDVDRCNFRHAVRCGMRLSCKMCDVEYGVVWTVLSCYVKCYIMQDVESYVMWNVVVCNCGDEECGICNVLWLLCHVRCGKWSLCVVMSDVVVLCKIKMWWCNAMWNMVWCELRCCDVECGCGVE